MNSQNFKLRLLDILHHCTLQVVDGDTGDCHHINALMVSERAVSLRG